MDPPPNPSPLRVLIRPSSSSSAPSTTSSTTLTPTPPKPSSSSPPPPPPLEGVVVVGFVGSRPDTDTVHLINRILDANAFGSGNLDTDLHASRPNDEDRHIDDWFKHRKISYFYEEEKGIVFLQFSSFSRGVEVGVEGYDLVLEECESDDLCGMLFMFSVCHVIIFVHEGLFFDTHVLKKFRMLQGAKNALAPFIRSQKTSTTAASKASVSARQTTVPTTSSRSPGRTGGGRHASVALMSGSGSHHAILLGQCSPVILFVFQDEFLDGSSSMATVEDLPDSSLNQPSSSSGMSRQGLALKGSGSVVMLARPTNKIEGNFRKKLQSSLDSQIRFLIKKCRILAGPESSSRGVNSTSFLPLFSLDTSRAVALLDKSTNYRGKSLDFATSLIDDVLNLKATSDVFMVENHTQSSNADDVQAIKDFIYRQSDSLRGRGALANTSSSSISGVGMVAAAAAAAAASAASGKPLSAPKLPSLESWASSSNVLLGALLSVKHQPMDEIGHIRRTVWRNTAPIKDEGSSPIGNNAVETSVTFLGSSRGLNLKFSIYWCQRALPAAKDVYLKDLPACYPTTMHKSQLEKALQAFQLMVKGPAVPSFAKKLEEECTSIWKSGRQLCDAVSLTGKPCMYQRHNDDGSGLPSTETKQHSSGYVFLHACACGRSRRLRDDPFDFDKANISFNCFPNCESFLPSLTVPKGKQSGPLNYSWSLVRLGGARYYEPSKGLLQSGFYFTEKYLSKWDIVLEKQREMCAGVICTGSEINLNPALGVISASVETKDSAALFSKEVPVTGMEHQRKVQDNTSSEDSNIHFGRGFPSFVMKKAFSEVVAGTTSAVSSFPPLQQKKQPKAGPEKCNNQKATGHQKDDKVRLINGFQKSEKYEYVSVEETSVVHENNCQINSDPLLQIGSNAVPVDMHGGGKMQVKSFVKHFSVYVGFEHECPYGHRFLLSAEHLNELGPPYSSSESHPTSSKESSGKFVAAELKTEKEKDKIHLQLSEDNAASVNNMRKTFRSSESITTCTLQHSGKEQLQSSSTEGLEAYVRLNDGSHAFSLLNRSLPIYMNCPLCKNSTEKREKINFASTVSQLQRIFLVTPPFPVVLATCPIIQFEGSCLPPSLLNSEQQSRFGIGVRVILPPESFLTLRLPFVYGVQLDDKSLQPLNYIEQHPELTAWLVKGTTLQIVSKNHIVDEDIQFQ